MFNVEMFNFFWHVTMTTKGRIFFFHTLVLGFLLAPWSHCWSAPADLRRVLPPSSSSSRTSDSFLFVGVLLFSQLAIILLLPVGLGPSRARWTEISCFAFRRLAYSLCFHIWIETWWIWYLFALQINRLQALWGVVARVVHQWGDRMKSQSIFGLQQLHGITRLHLPKVEPFSYFLLSFQNCWHPKEQSQRGVQNHPTYTYQ